MRDSGSNKYFPYQECLNDSPECEFQTADLLANIETAQDRGASQRYRVVCKGKSWLGTCTSCVIEFNAAPHQA